MNGNTPRPRGRLFFANPGPTNIPDSVLRAMVHASVDWFAPEFLEMYRGCVGGLQRLLGTRGDIFFYAGSGHAAWEASLVNLFSPGDRLLFPQTGAFSESWAKMARDFGLDAEVLACDWRNGIDYTTIEAALAADRTHAVKALCVVHNETSTGLVLDPARCRAALDAAGHPALLLVDTISSLGIIDFCFDAWGVDCAVGGSQKGLMLPTGLSFTGISERALAAHRNAKLPKAYFNWSAMLSRLHRSFIGTVPTTFFYGMQEALRLLLDDEGLPAVFARHARLAEAVRRCVAHWASGGGPQIFCRNQERYSNSVTAVLMPEGHDAEAVRSTALRSFNVSLGGGLGPLNGRVFRIGHLGDLNEPMILGTLAAVEMALVRNKVPHAPGGVDAAMKALAAV